jgi:hypothetical protein
MAKYIERNRQTGSFVATDVASRQRITVFVYRDVIATGNLTDPNAFRFGLPSLITEDGDRLNCLSQGEYEVVGSGRKLHSDDPEAI